MATPLSPSGAFGGVGVPGMELTLANTIVTGTHPGWPGLNVYVANSGTEPIPVSLASGSINISGTFGNVQPKTAVTNAYAFSTASRQLLTLNPGRVSFLVYNDSDGNFVLSYGSTASLGSIVTVIPPWWTYEPSSPAWQGALAGIGVAPGSGTVYVTELVP